MQLEIRAINTIMISIIIPFHNEEENLTILTGKISENLVGQSFEIIYVDDGSTDHSRGVVESLQKKYGKNTIQLLSHRDKMGKGSSLRDGIKKATGEIIIFMDADLQDDPGDLPNFLETLEKGYDFVNGWREKRQDGIIKTLPSRIGNALILRMILKSTYHDINCGYKAMRKEVLDEINLYGDNFRFLPVAAEMLGFKTTEIVVSHHPRKFGKSKYGFFRRFTIFADILTAYFIFRFAEKPLHFFGAVGGVFFGLGSFLALYLSYERLFHGVVLSRRPALLLAVLLIIVGMQIIMTGIVAELIVYLHARRTKS